MEIMCSKLPIVLFLAIAGCISGFPSDKIVGGVPLNITEVPWQVSLQNAKRGPFCGGSIITDRWILTSAHCLRPDLFANIQVRVGATHKLNDGQLVNVSETFMHDRYHVGIRDFDFGLIKLEKKLNFSDFVQPIAMPDLGASDVPVGRLCLVTGYGDTRSHVEPKNVLRGTEVPIVDRKYCAEVYPRLTTRMICAGFENGGRDPCHGDYGGPLVSFETGEQTLIGIVSWGNSCGLAGFPGVYSKVVAAREWIHSYANV